MANIFTPPQRDGPQHDIEPAFATRIGRRPNFRMKNTSHLQLPRSPFLPTAALVCGVVAVMVAFDSPAQSGSDTNSPPAAEARPTNRDADAPSGRFTERLVPVRRAGATNDPGSRIRDEGLN